jgi:hypothetical protein
MIEIKKGERGAFATFGQRHTIAMNTFNMFEDIPFIIAMTHICHLEW